MSGPFLNTIKTDPSLKDLLSLWRSEIFLSINCHAIATVQSFDSANQTVVAKMNYTKTFVRTKPNGGSTEYNVDYPLVMDCPVIILGGGACSLTFPIEQGDECLILFNDRDIDNWFAGNSSGPTATNRRHSFSDGIAIVGVRSLANSLSDYDSTRAVLQNGTTMVGVGESLIKIANNQTTLNTLLQDLITDLKNLITQIATITVTGVLSGGAVSGPPANAATIAAFSTTLTTLGTQIGELLE